MHEKLVNTYIHFKIKLLTPSAIGRFEGTSQKKIVLSQPDLSGNSENIQ